MAHYRLVEAKHKYIPPVDKDVADAEWDVLDRRYSGKIVGLLMELKGMYTKYGQIGAGLTNLFSPVWIEKLRTLEDAVTPQPKEVVFKTIEEDTGKSVWEIFSEFDDVPLGSASIGQVCTISRDHNPHI